MWRNIKCKRKGLVNNIVAGFDNFYFIYYRLQIYFLITHYFPILSFGFHFIFISNKQIINGICERMVSNLQIMSKCTFNSHLGTLLATSGIAAGKRVDKLNLPLARLIFVNFSLKGALATGNNKANITEH